MNLRRRIMHILADIRRGEGREAYALFLIGVVLAVLGLANVVSSRILTASILLALSFLVFHTSSEQARGRVPLERVLRDRQDFGPISKLLPAVRDLRIYGPTAINILVASADIRRFVLDAGGHVRIIVSDDTAEAYSHAATQLDDNLDFQSSLRNSFAALAKLDSHPNFSYRRLSVNPGFSLLIVNAEDRDGYVVFESHGFKDANIADRMHIVIRREESGRWHQYWVARFEAMWNSADPGE